MSHVDEGALHAYLDGALDEYPQSDADRIRAHLDACASCALRLEAERRIRDEAQGILDLATPSVEVPSLEELRSYVRATRPAPAPAAVRLYRLGWAASVVLAVGVGWMVRDGQVTSGASPLPEAAPIVSVASSEAGETAAEARQVVAQPTTDDLLESRAVDAGRASGGVVGFAEAEAPATAATEVLQEVASPDLAQVAANEAFRAEESVPDMFDVARDVDVETASREKVTDDARLAEAEETMPVSAPIVAAELDAVVASLPTDGAGARSDSGSASGAGAVAEPPAASADEQARRRASVEVTGIRPPQTVTSALRAAPAGVGDRVDTSPAEGDAEEPPLVIQGLDIVSFANLAEGTAPTGLHIIQRLADGVLLDVYHLPEGFDPDGLEPVEEGRNEVRSEKADGRWVVLRAALPVEQLQGYLRQLQGEGS